MRLFRNPRIQVLESQVKQLELDLRSDEILLSKANDALNQERNLRETIESICRQQKARINQLELELYGAKTTITQLTLRIDDLTHPARDKRTGRFTRAVQ